MAPYERKKIEEMYPFRSNGTWPKEPNNEEQLSVVLLSSIVITSVRHTPGVRVSI